MFYKHGKSHVSGVSQTHVQPTFNIPIAPEAAKKLDRSTSPTVNHNHDNCQLQNSPHTVPTDTTTEEFVFSIPIQFEVESEETENYSNYSTVLQPQTSNKTPEQIEFPPEYFTNREDDQTSSDNEMEEYDYIIQNRKQ